MADRTRARTSPPAAGKDENTGPATAGDGALLTEAFGYALRAHGRYLSDIPSWHKHVPFAWALIGVHRPRLLVELGVHKGDSYMSMCSAMAELGVDGQAFGIDAWVGDPHAGSYDGSTILSELRAVHDPAFGSFSTLLRKTFDEARVDIADGSVDLLHIDGYHTYDAVRQDFESWRPKLSRRAVVLFHDTAVLTSDFGVHRFWAEVSKRRTAAQFLFGHGLGVLAAGSAVPRRTRALIQLFALPLPDGLDARAIMELIAERFAADAAERRSAPAMQRAAAAEQAVVALQQQVAALSADLDAARRPPLRRLSDRMGTARQRIGPFARRAGHAVINRLPVSAETKGRIKLRLLRSVGPLVGLSNFATSGGPLFAPNSERYLELARMGTGRPVSQPPRSVSIIIPVFNKVEYTLRCLEAIATHTGDIAHEVIVVDDGSTDQTAALVNRWPGVIYLRNETNIGFIASCNRGAEQAGNTYLCFLNNDTEVRPGWLSALVNTFELMPHVGLAGSKLIYPDGHLQEAGGLIWNDGSGWNWGRMRDQNGPRFNYARLTDYCSGASIVVPRALFRSLGGFDTLYSPAYGEDSDIAFRIRALGLGTIYQPLSRVVHYEGVTSGTDVSTGTKAYQVDNARKLAARWAPVLPLQGSPGVNAELAADRGRLGRILVIDQITPEPDSDAGSVTAFEIMRGLRDLGYKITFAPCSNFAYIPNYSDLLAAIGIESILYPGVASFRQHMATFGKDYDAAVIFRVSTARDYLGTVKQYAPQAKLVFHTSDLHFLREERATELHAGQRSRAAATREAELATIAAAAITIVHSHHEKDVIAAALPQAPVAVFPWIYEPRGKGRSFSQRRDLIFVGSYRHDPNVDAVEYFAADIMPLLADRLEGVSFIAAGSNPPPSVTGLAGPRIRVPGFLPDIEGPLMNARVMVAPLRYGAGLKGKIVSAMACGLPVVTTSIGAEGMALTPGEHVLVADGAEAFADSVVQLYQDEALWRRLSEAGLDYVARTTSRAAGMRILTDILGRMGLPHLDMRGDQSYVGSPPQVTSPGHLAALAITAHGDAVGPRRGLLLPPSAIVPPVPGWDVVADAGAGPYDAVAAIVDATDRPGVAALAQRISGLLAPGGHATLVFAPPRLVGSVAGYEMRAPFAERTAEPLPPPMHEAYGDVLAGAGLAVTWRPDASLLGFPSVMVAHLGGAA